MDTKKKRTTLKTKFFIAFLVGLIAAVVSFVVLSFISEVLIEDFFLNSSYMHNCEKYYMDSLQSYVTENKIKATDILKLRKWEEKNDIAVFSVSRERVLIYDNTYAGDAPLYGADSILVRNNWQYLYSIEFYDGAADVFINKYFKHDFYIIAVIISAAISALVWAGLLATSINTRIRYIHLLKNEIERNKDNNHNNYTINGNDELTELALALNTMQSELNISYEREQIQKRKHEAFVLGMVHDLRTPLTGLMGYLELCKKSIENPQELNSYLVRSIDKINQIRDLSNKLLDHFMSNNENNCNLEDSANVLYILGDYLSDFSAQVEACGFTINIDSLKWSDVDIRVDTDFVCRILNNILSNIDKYATRDYPVMLSSFLDDEYFGITISNHICKPSEYIQGTHIGTENISIMMNLMHGKMEIKNDDEIYSITLFFKIWI